MEEAGEDFMECPEFAAGVYAPGIGQGWEELINVELEITGQFEKVYVSFDLKFLHDAFQREITHVDERGDGRDFGRTPCFFCLVEGIDFSLEEGNRVSHPACGECLHWTQRLVASVGFQEGFGCRSAPKDYGANF